MYVNKNLWFPFVLSFLSVYSVSEIRHMCILLHIEQYKRCFISVEIHDFCRFHKTISSDSQHVTFKCDFQRELDEFSLEITLKSEVVTNWRNVFVKTSNFHAFGPNVPHMWIQLHTEPPTTAYSWCPSQLSSHIGDPYVNHQQKTKSKIRHRQSLPIYHIKWTNTTNMIWTCFLASK